MRVLVTGAAGFIGFHAVQALRGAGHDVIGVDNLTPYYDPALKRARLAELQGPGFSFHEVDIADSTALRSAAGSPVDAILHLAAQAGVRYSLENPFAYERSNLAGHLSVLELARGLPQSPHLVYASSSSVYGETSQVPFQETDPCNDPVSLYAATKRSGELMSGVYARLYDLPVTGLRFFTVYGPYGRPDMAYWTFADQIERGEPILLFNNGEMERDFTFIGDVAPTIARIIGSPPPGGTHRLYNIGNNRPVSLRRFVAAIEAATGFSATIRLAPMQPGDVTRTYADISRAYADFGFSPTTSIEEGLRSFVDWRRGRSRPNGKA